MKRLRLDAAPDSSQKRHALYSSNHVEFHKNPTSRLLALLDLKKQFDAFSQSDFLQSDLVCAERVEELITHLRKFESAREREIILAIIERMACALISVSSFLKINCCAS